MNILAKCKSTAIASFLAAATLSVALPACEQGAMYCLAASGDYGAQFTLVSGTPGCLEQEIQTLYVNYYLGATTGEVPRPDPSTPSVAVTLAEARGARDAADAQLRAIQNYSRCASAQGYVPPKVDLTYQTQPFTSLAPFASGDPDQNDQCFATQFAPAAMTTPNIPAVPKCDADTNSKAMPAYTSQTINYKVSDLVVKVKPAIQGQLVRGKLEYSGKNGCSAVYNFVALNPAVKCKAVADCKSSVKVNAELKADVVCAKRAGEAEGLCIYQGAM